MLLSCSYFSKLSGKSDESHKKVLIFYLETQFASFLLTCKGILALFRGALCHTFMHQVLCYKLAHVESFLTFASKFIKIMGIQAGATVNANFQTGTLLTVFLKLRYHYMCEDKTLTQFRPGLRSPVGV